MLWLSLSGRYSFVFRPAYFKIIEECVSQIVLHKSGLDPDFSRKHFDLDLQPLLDELKGKCVKISLLILITSKSEVTVVKITIKATFQGKYNSCHFHLTVNRCLKQYFLRVQHVFK